MFWLEGQGLAGRKKRPAKEEAAVSAFGEQNIIELQTELSKLSNK